MSKHLKKYLRRKALAVLSKGLRGFETHVWGKKTLKTLWGVAMRYLRHRLFAVLMLGLGSKTILKAKNNQPDLNWQVMLIFWAS